MTHDPTNEMNRGDYPIVFFTPVNNEGIHDLTSRALPSGAVSWQLPRIVADISIHWVCAPQAIKLVEMNRIRHPIVGVHYLWPVISFSVDNKRYPLWIKSDTLGSAKRVKTNSLALKNLVFTTKKQNRCSGCQSCACTACWKECAKDSWTDLTTRSSNFILYKHIYAQWRVPNRLTNKTREIADPEQNFPGDLLRQTHIIMKKNRVLSSIIISGLKTDNRSQGKTCWNELACELSNGMSHQTAPLWLCIQEHKTHPSEGQWFITQLLCKLFGGLNVCWSPNQSWLIQMELNR